MTTTDSPKKAHRGRNIKRFREMFCQKQEALAIELREDWSQKKVSSMEENEEVSEELLQQVSKALKLPIEVIKNFDEQAAVNYFNTFNDQSLSNSNGSFSAFQCTFIPLEKLVEIMEENRRLYERMLSLEKEKVTLLDKKIRFIHTRFIN